MGSSDSSLLSKSYVMVECKGARMMRRREVAGGQERRKEQGRNHHGGVVGITSPSSRALLVVLLALLVLPLDGFLRPISKIGNSLDSVKRTSRSRTVVSYMGPPGIGEVDSNRETKTKEASIFDPFDIRGRGKESLIRKASLLSATRVKEEEKIKEEGKAMAIYRDALLKTAVSVGTALFFGLCVWLIKGPDSGLEYYSGYLVEQSLSVDNLFVFVVLFEYFKVPPENQGRVLSWGIFGAMVMRAMMVFAGVEALENFRVVLLGFAAILIATSFKLLTEEEENEDVDLADNDIIKFARGLITTVDEYDGSKFFTTRDGVSVATPLLLVLICVELSDVVFAVDSVPAVFGVTKDPFIVYTSNIFAIIGLRSLYTILAEAVVDLPYLKPAVAIILGLVGGKLGLEYFGYEIPNTISLGVIVSLLAGGIGASIISRKEPNPDEG